MKTKKVIKTLKEVRDARGSIDDAIKRIEEIDKKKKDKKKKSKKKKSDDKDSTNTDMSMTEMLNKLNNMSV